MGPPADVAAQLRQAQHSKAGRAGAALPDAPAMPARVATPPTSKAHLDECDAVCVAEVVDADALGQGGLSQHHHLRGAWQRVLAGIRKTWGNHWL